MRTKAVVPDNPELQCFECDSVVYSCDDCQEYFEPEQEIYCIDSSHVCCDCAEERLKENEQIEKEQTNGE